MNQAQKRRLGKTLVFLGAFSFLLGGIIWVLSGNLPALPEMPEIPTESSAIPRYLLYSLTRMLIAFTLSLIIGISVGILAATNKRAGYFIIPILDIFQSIPVVAYIPIALTLFVADANDVIGLEVTAVILIITSMIWNLAYGVYEGVSTLPKDAKESMSAFGVRGWHRIWRLYLPGSVPKLVYNCILSWANGWYFLILCEILDTTPGSPLRLDGIGSFLVKSLQESHYFSFSLALSALLALIIATEFFVWNPLSRWSEKYKYEMSAAGAAFRTGTRKGKSFRRRMRRRFVQLTGWLERRFLDPVLRLGRPLARFKPRPTILSGISWVLGKFFLFLAILALAIGGYFLFTGAWDTLAQPWPEEAYEIPSAIAASFLRVVSALLVCILICYPLATWAGQNPKVSRILTPLAEIGASVPATAFFPPILVLAYYFGGMTLASTLLLITGMIWYLLFNLIAGVRSIPEDLKLTAKSLGLTGWQRWKRLVFPASFPSLVTGSITAFGGGWNTLVVAEYLDHEHQAHGIGNMMMRATGVEKNETLVLLTVLALVITVALINRFFWRPLFEMAASRFKME